MRQRFVHLCILVLASAVFAACGPDDNGTDNNGTTTNNGTTNNGTTNNGTDNNGTDNNGTDNNGTVQCRQTGDDCTDGQPTAAGFVCVEGSCRNECDPTADPVDCSSGALCAETGEGTGVFYCRVSDCTGPTDLDSCPEGQKCVSFINEADLCVQAGQGAEGDACQDTFGCGAGLECLFGQCRLLCEGDATCDADGGQNCIGDEEGFFGAGIGYCGQQCESYVDDCGEGLGCFPLVDDVGECFPNGTKGAFETCDLQTGSPLGDCGDNMRCLAFEENVGTCVGFCNSETGASVCPGSQDGAAYVRFLNLLVDDAPEAVDVYVDDVLTANDLQPQTVAGSFTTLTSGTRTIDIVAADAADNSAPIASTTVDLTAARGATLAVVPDAQNGAQLADYDVPRGISSSSNDETTVRFAHAIPDLAAVDVLAVASDSVDLTSATVLATNVDFGDAGGFTQLTAGTYDIYLFGAGTVPMLGQEAAVFEGVTTTGGEVVTLYGGGTLDDTDTYALVATSAAYAEAPAPANLPVTCWEGVLGAGPAGGLCMEECTAADYGSGECSGDGWACSPNLRLDPNTHLCLPGGTAAVGEACQPGDCAEGAYCELYGDGTGVCRSYCEPGTQTNAGLSCAGDRICEPIGQESFNFGRCRVGCEPMDNADASCPENLQSCFPASASAQAYCEASGSAMVGEQCQIGASSCEPGILCTDTASPVSDTFGQGAMCQQTCQLFADDTGCAGDDICRVDWVSFSAEVGFCGPRDTDMEQPNLTGCAEDFAFCGETGVCLPTQQGAVCVYLCDLEEGEGCSEGEVCSEWFEGSPLGLCLPPQ